MRASMSMFACVAVVCVLSSAACGGSKPVPVEHQPVELSPAQQTTVQRFVGPWRHSGGAEEQQRALAAVDVVTDQMNRMIRGMAQSRLGEAVRIDGTVEFAEHDGIVTITRSERTHPFVAPANGQAFDTVNDEGDEVRGSLKLEGDALITQIGSDDGGGERTYRVDDRGRLEIVTRIYSPRLPGDVVYTCHYERP